MRPDRDSGFTLLELLVVLAVLSLVLAIGVPRLVSALPGVETKRTASDLAAVLKDARFQAIRSSFETAVVLDLGARQYRVEGESQSHSLPAGLEITLTTGGASSPGGRSGEIAFYADGSSSGGRVALGQGGHVYHVDVDWLTGRVSLAPQ